MAVSEPMITGRLSTSDAATHSVIERMYRCEISLSR